MSSDVTVLRALASGRLPDGVDPRSRAGREYQKIIDYVHACVLAAPPLSDNQRALIRRAFSRGEHGLS